MLSNHGCFTAIILETPVDHFHEFATGITRFVLSKEYLESFHWSVNISVHSSASALMVLGSNPSLVHR